MENVYLNDGKLLTREDIQKFAEKFGATFYEGERFDIGPDGKKCDVIIFEDFFPKDKPYGPDFI